MFEYPRLNFYNNRKTNLQNLREFVTKISRLLAIDSMRSVILFSALTLMLRSQFNLIVQQLF